jgi:predicted RNase H-like nuclease (RuvC/YqgF family)
MADTEYNQVNNSENQGIGWKVASIIMGVLLIGSIAFGVMYYNRHNDASHRAIDLSTQLDNTRTQLEGELATLNTAYDDQIIKNDTLSSELKQKIAEVEDLQVRIAKAKKDLKSSQANNKKIQVRLDQMEELKVALEKDIAMLRDENVALAASNHELNTELVATKDEVVNLNTKVMSLTAANSKLTSRLQILAPAGFRADNFTVTSEDRKDKLTTKGKKIDEITVKFDLNNIPEEFQGNREIYLVLTEFNGNPVAVVPGKEVNLTFGDTPVNVRAADLEKVDLKDRQSVTMSFEPTDDLNPGTYNVMVYADNGYLGSTGFMVSK